MPSHLRHLEPFKSSQSTRYSGGQKSFPHYAMSDFLIHRILDCNKIVVVLYYISVVCYATDNRTVFNNSLLNDWFSIRLEVPLSKTNENWNKRNLCGLMYLTVFFPSLVSNAAKQFLEVVLMTFSPASSFNSFSSQYSCIDSCAQFIIWEVLTCMMLSRLTMPMSKLCTIQLKRFSLRLHMNGVMERYIAESTSYFFHWVILMCFTVCPYVAS